MMRWIKRLTKMDNLRVWASLDKLDLELQYQRVDEAKRCTLTDGSVLCSYTKSGHEMISATNTTSYISMRTGASPLTCSYPV